jgi:hypothetical protein
MIEHGSAFKVFDLAQISFFRYQTVWLLVTFSAHIAYESETDVPFNSGKFLRKQMSVDLMDARYTQADIPCSIRFTSDPATVR